MGRNRMERPRRGAPCAMGCGVVTTSEVCPACRKDVAREGVGVEAPVDRALSVLAAADAYVAGILANRDGLLTDRFGNMARDRIFEARTCLQAWKRGRRTP